MESAIEPAKGNSLGDLFKLAEKLIPTGFLPKAVDTPAKAVAIILTGREMGLGEMESLRSIDVIQGKPAPSSRLLLAQARRKIPGLVVNFPEATDQACTVVIIRPEPGEEAFSFRFTIDDARKMDLQGKDNYKKQARTMLMWRACAQALRFKCPEALGGLYAKEELETLDMGYSAPQMSQDRQVKKIEANVATRAESPAAVKPQAKPKESGPSEGSPVPDSEQHQEMSNTDGGSESEGNGGPDLPLGEQDLTNWQCLLRLRDAIVGAGQNEEKTFWQIATASKDPKYPAFTSERQCIDKIFKSAEKNWKTTFVYIWLRQAQDEYIGENEGKLIGAFSKQGIKLHQIEGYLGKALWNLSEAELADCWDVFNKVKDGTPFDEVTNVQ